MINFYSAMIIATAILITSLDSYKSSGDYLAYAIAASALWPALIILQIYKTDND